ncbi:hypothetical protein HNR46_004170 [Haloferula luteola]|uniref:Uncharacterized protein n=1 Tax=Haloferula luteola TaxID=595692 RepID=A0A840V7B2_9BACT|nr:hypothetical protein [Haloferula luteola]MBB5353905.1 hypothetical protein [Haloferula luteola]
MAVFFGDVVYIWLTKGWLFISENDANWTLHITTDAILSAIRMFAGIAAAFGFILHAARFPRSKPKTKPNKSRLDNPLPRPESEVESP